MTKPRKPRSEPGSTTAEGVVPTALTPRPSRHEVEITARSLQRAAHALALARFTSLDALHADLAKVSDELKDRIQESFDDPNGSGLIPEPIRSAIYYNLVVHSAETAMAVWDRDANALGFLEPAFHLATWVGESNAKLDAQAFDAFIESRREGGKKGGAKAKDKAVDRAQVVRAACEMGWPDKTYGINKALGKRFKRDPERIGQILRAELNSKMN